MALEKQEYDALVAKVGTEAADKIKSGIKDAEDRINAAAADRMKGLITADQLEDVKKEYTAKAQEHVDQIAKLEEVVKEQGKIISAKLEKAEPNSKSFEQFLIEQIPAIKEAKANGKTIEITASQLKAAGVTSLTSTIQNMAVAPGSPYMPNIGGPELELFGIIRNPNYMVNQVDLGRTDKSILAWLNETGEDGSPAEVLEGNPKPLLSNTFQVETSKAVKVAGYYELTDEFEDDAPQLATRVRRNLQERVIRAWDDAIQTAVFNVATNFAPGAMALQTPFANFWDGLYAMGTQVRKNNYIPNTYGLNPDTNFMMQTDKNSNGTYLLPPFKDEIERMLIQANKIPAYNAIAGDLTQYKVDVYKEFVIKIGWINDNFTNNKFCIVGEMRYHRYISDNRKLAIVKGNLSNVRQAIDGGSAS